MADLALKGLKLLVDGSIMTKHFRIILERHPATCLRAWHKRDFSVSPIVHILLVLSVPLSGKTDFAAAFDWAYDLFMDGLIVMKHTGIVLELPLATCLRAWHKRDFFVNIVHLLLVPS